MASALAMDKWRKKLIWQAVGIPTPRYALLDATSDFNAMARDLGLPLIVKPVREGSTIGLSKVTAAADLAEAYRRAARHDALVLAEEVHRWDRELTVSILGNGRCRWCASSRRLSSLRLPGQVFLRRYEIFLPERTRGRSGKRFRNRHSRRTASSAARAGAGWT